MEPLKLKASSTSTCKLVAAIEPHLPRLNSARRLFLGYSGGQDSHVLLDALMRLSALFPALKLTDKLTAVHIHHGLSVKADAWAAHCQHVCEAYHVNFISEKVNLTDFSTGIEAAARQARYQIFQELMQAEDILLLGQHGDDQVETLLLQLFRGAGPRGLAAMAVDKPSESYRLLRPFLKLKQTDIENYARQHDLKWVHDDSNDDVHFERNFLRHTILPKLNHRYPALLETISRSARLCAEQEEMLADYLQQDLTQHVKHGDLHCFDLMGLQNYSHPRQKALIRTWLTTCKVLMPSEVKLAHILTDVCAAREDRQPELRWGDWVLRRYRNHMYLLNQAELNADTVQMTDQAWRGEALKLISGQTISSQDLVDLGVDLKQWNWQGVTIGLRQGGERFQRQGRKHSQPLKKFLQEQKIPPWQRENLVLVKRNQNIIAILGIALAEHHQF